MGLAYSDLAGGRLAEAEAGFVDLRRLRPDDVSVLEGIGNVYYRQARWKDAELAFAEVLRRKPDNSETRETLERVRRFMAPDVSPAGA